MSYYSTDEFDRLIEARSKNEFVSAYEVEQAARRLQAIAVADFISKAGTGLKAFFTTPAQAELAVAVPYKMSAREQAYLARGEEIADDLIALGRAVSAAAARIYAPVKAWLRAVSMRGELTALDDRTLADIGLTRGDIDRVAKGLWVPENRSARTNVAIASRPAAANLDQPQKAA